MSKQLKFEGETDIASSSAPVTTENLTVLSAVPVVNKQIGIPIGGLGRIKEKPFCKVPALRKENMSAKQLSDFCFKPEQILMKNNGFILDGAANNEKSNTSESNTVQGEKGEESNTVVDNSTIQGNSLNNKGGDRGNSTVHLQEWALLKDSILQRTESRNGRDLQRFQTDHQTGHLLRLTTGTVPIMKNGSILLVSSSRKEGWILPKGGWESDESLEVSALRESYEEGGILGIMGQRLTEVTYETRKAKKRRLEMESIKKKYEIEIIREGGTSGSNPVQSQSSAISLPSATSSTCHSEEGDTMHSSSHSKDHIQGNIFPLSTTRGANNLSGELVRDDAASLGSIASDASAHCNHVRMLMLPLYVLEVREHWPESGRARKVVDIDTAIDIMAPRPEFQKVLIEVKQKGYHLNPNGGIFSEQPSVDI
mmetsp:Transcript_11139/g.16215  ORF Transcript_11139/g.16215 Transcript_11139/m.16215 type:complete len:425 (-) Transcript_11139:63-1337(-)